MEDQQVTQARAMGSDTPPMGIDRAAQDQERFEEAEREIYEPKPLSPDANTLPKQPYDGTCGRESYRLSQLIDEEVLGLNGDTLQYDSAAARLPANVVYREQLRRFIASHTAEIRRLVDLLDEKIDATDAKKIAGELGVGRTLKQGGQVEAAKAEPKLNLLKVCIWALNIIQCEDPRDWPNSVIQEIKERLQAAIAKAEGEQ